VCLCVQRPTLFHRLMGAMKTASRETLASDHSDTALPVAAAAAVAANGRSVSPSFTAAAYQQHRRSDLRDHSPSPCRFHAAIFFHARAPAHDYSETYYAPPLWYGALSDDVRLSRTSGLSREQRGLGN